MSMFVVKSFVIQSDGFVYGSINNALRVFSTRIPSVLIMIKILIKYILTKIIIMIIVYMHCNLSNKKAVWYHL